MLVYKAMAAGASIVVGTGRNFGPISLRHPTFVCANDVPETDLLYQYCMREPNTPLMSLAQSELMALCPFFWMIKRQASLSDCPLVVANVMTPNDDRLIQNQEALLVGILVHLYHEVDHSMVVAITDASDLNASASLKNPPSYALYYAGKLLRSATLVQQ